jgi:hypothetical protein
MSFVDAKENAVLDSLFGAGAPASYNVGLSSTEPTDAGGNITEPGDTYARVTISNGGTVFTPASGGAKRNGGVSGSIVFPQASAPWGAALGWWVLYDSVTPILYGTLAPAKVVDTGDVLCIPANQMIISLD